jgi:hypothetical protein
VGQLFDARESLRSLLETEQDETAVLNDVVSDRSSVSSLGSGASRIHWPRVSSLHWQDERESRRCALERVKSFLMHNPTVGVVPHLAPSGAPPLGQNTETKVSLASQLTAPSACTEWRFVVPDRRHQLRLVLIPLFGLSLALGHGGNKAQGGLRPPRIFQRCHGIPALHLRPMLASMRISENDAHHSLMRA